MPNPNAARPFVACARPGTPMSEREKWDSVREAAAYLNVCEKTLYNWISQGRLPSARLGRRHRIRRADLDALLRRPMVTPVAEGADGNVDVAEE